MQFGALPKLAYEFSVQISDNPDSISHYAKDMCATHSEQFGKWRSAFAPLYAEACKSGGGKTFVAALTLRVSGLSTEITAQRLAIQGKSAPDLFQYESCEIINLSRLVIADPTFRKGLAFDCRVVPGLFIVIYIVICENLQIRQEAMEFLRATVPRREGAWDSVTLVQLGEQVLQMAGAAPEADELGSSGGVFQRVVHVDSMAAPPLPGLL